MIRIYVQFSLMIYYRDRDVMCSHWMQKGGGVYS